MEALRKLYKEEASETLSGAVARIVADYYMAHQGALPPAGVYVRILHQVEKPLIEQTLVLTKGNQIKAAEILGLNRNTLRKKIQELGIMVTK